MSMLTPDETILGLIAIQACHGYDLIEAFRDPAALGDIWKMSTSQIYAVLKRLEGQGLIAGRVVESANAPSRTEYTLTPAGRQRLAAWLDDPQPSASIRRVRVEFLSRLFIARRLNVPTVPIALRQRRACEDERERLLQERSSKRAGMSYLTHELVMAQLDAVLRCFERCEMLPKDMET
ncbi:MAG: PadR family transcriptional regulator [Anaerolineae bacterium]|nr:PadR family transcriptional regulator [Anaerolineae bacterium]